MPIVLGNAYTMPVLDEDVSILLKWVSTALADFRAHSQNPVGLGAAGGNATLWTSTTGKNSGTLRVDRQRVIGVNQRVETVPLYIMKKGKELRGVTDPAARETMEGQGYRVKSEGTKDITVADYVWTLFATQIDKTHNQLFVLNNNNMLNTIGQDQLTAIWRETIQNGGGAVVTNDQTRLPEGFVKTNAVGDTEEVSFY